jgi:ribosomal protein S18 acetylase RimI-like enzyme
MRSAGVVTVRAAREADIGLCAVLAGVHRDEDPERVRARLEADLQLPDRSLLVASLEGRFAGYARALRFEPPADAPMNIAPAGWYLVGLLVASACRRRGVGLELTRARLAWVFDRADEAWCFANARNGASLGLHTRLGFEEVTRDFAFPGVSFDGGVGVLARVRRPQAPTDR